MDRIATWISRLFGVALLFLSGFVALETMMRKLFNTSLQGADELGGYVLAFGASAAFVVALIDRAHVRIDVLHQRFRAGCGPGSTSPRCCRWASWGCSSSISAGSSSAIRWPTGRRPRPRGRPR
ncbi:MAG: TRAP transporter small permease subunit [Paracoccaceae bacterium]